MRSATFLLFIVGCTCAPALDSDLAGIAVRSWNARLQSESITRVEVIPFPRQPDLFAAICDYQQDWEGFFGIYHFRDRMIDWEADPDVIPTEQSIHKMRVVDLSGFSTPIIEVFGRTHMGNGSLYLYELRGRKLILLLQTKAVDFNPDPLQFRNGLLEPTYCDVDGDGTLDLILTGTVEDWGEKGDTLVSSGSYRRTFLWNGHQRKFESSD
jgi:hypothetical protein